MFDTKDVRRGLRAAYLATQPEDLVRSVKEQGLEIQYAQQGIAFRGVHPVHTSMGVMHNCVVARRVISRHTTALGAHIAWLQIQQKTHQPRVLSAKELDTVAQDMVNLQQRVQWIITGAELILQAQPEMLPALQEIFGHQELAISETFKQARLALKQRAKMEEVELYKAKKAAKPKGPKPKGPKVYVTDLHPHLHKKIVMPEAPIPDGSEEVVFQLREQMRLRKEAERAKYQAWSQGADDDN